MSSFHLLLLHRSAQATYAAGLRSGDTRNKIIKKDDVILSRDKLATSANYAAPYYAIFSILLSLHPSWFYFNTAPTNTPETLLPRV
jgi:hypothetical protein